MKRMARMLLVLAMLLSMAASTGFAAGPAERIALNQVQQNGGELLMYVSVTDAAGDPAEDEYAAERFDVAVDGKSIGVDSVEAFNPETQGVHYVFCVDVSLTVKEEMMANVRAALTEFVNNFGPLDTATIITFGEKVVSRVQNTSDREAILNAIAALEANEGMTALYKGALDGVVAATQAGGRSAVIMITDGQNEATEEMKIYTKENVFSSVVDAQVPLFCVGLNDNIGVDTQSLIEFAQATGGRQYEVPAAECAQSLNSIRLIMQNALTLRATLVNTDGRTGFVEESSFVAGFQSATGGFLMSNELKLNVNWRSVPAPQAEPTATPTPEISLELDSDTVQRVDGAQTITGAVLVEAGEVGTEDLSLYVNGERWRVVDIGRNGNGYTFRIEGTIDPVAERLEVQARVESASVSSRVSAVTVVAPEAPTATPAPGLTVELDGAGEVVTAVSGETIPISGLIATQGDVPMDQLQLYVNGEAVALTLTQISENQYEFAAEYCVAETGRALDVQVRVGEDGIASAKQRIQMAAPTPTPAPVLRLYLNAPDVMADAAGEAEISGWIEVDSGAVAAEDIVVYIGKINSEAAVVDEGGGIFSFTARTVAGAEAAQMPVSARLLSDSSVKSDAAMLQIELPTPEPTPSPTPRPVVTPPPQTRAPASEALNSGEPTAAPEEAAGGTIGQIVRGLQQRGLLWIVVAAAVVVIAAVAALLILRGKRRRVEPVDDDLMQKSKSEQVDVGTVPLEGGEPTEGGEDDRGRSARRESFVAGTVPLENSLPGWEAEGGMGTMPEEEPSDTGTMAESDEDERCMEVVMDETYRGNARAPRRFSMREGEERVMGRFDEKLGSVAGGDIRFEGDGRGMKVSYRHAKLSCDGGRLYIEDTNSKNGTTLNGKKLYPGERTPLNDGDTVCMSSELRIVFHLS